MAKVSIIIPSRNEKCLVKTVDEVFSKATGEIEVIVVLDGPTSDPLPSARPNLEVITKSEPCGLRIAVNDATKTATGKYLLKADAHCMFGEGFDEILQSDCENNWVVIPRRYGMDGRKPEVWERQLDVIADYYYLACP